MMSLAYHIIYNANTAAGGGNDGCIFGVYYYFIAHPTPRRENVTYSSPFCLVLRWVNANYFGDNVNNGREREMR